MAAKKNRLAQSGPWRQWVSGGSVVQEVTATRAADPNAAPLAAELEEVSSGAALGGTDMRPTLTPILAGAVLEVALSCTLVCSAELEQWVDVTLDLSDDGGATWVEIAEADPGIVIPANLQQDAAQPQRVDFAFTRTVELSEAFPDYVAGTPILARASLGVQSAVPATELVSEGDPGNCRVTLRELASR